MVLKVEDGPGWSCDAPWLYPLVLTLEDRSGAPMDVEALRVGLRSVCVTGGQLRVVNGGAGAKGGGAVEVRGVNRHEHDQHRCVSCVPWTGCVLHGRVVRVHTALGVCTWAGAC